MLHPALIKPQNRRPSTREKSTGEINTDALVVVAELESFLELDRQSLVDSVK